ncbi:hypothetical protein [Nocardia sp. NPDC058705]|uniref:hypothetical protein n=1 Tax=Nocardia sp. NPDC058705 TaxID=3346609 RepID=UPI0036B1CED4
MLPVHELFDLDRVVQERQLELDVWGEFDKVGADDAGPRWASLSAMLADLAHSLETGTPFDQHWTPAVESGELNWQFHP